MDALALERHAHPAKPTASGVKIFDTEHLQLNIGRRRERNFQPVPTIIAQYERIDTLVALSTDFCLTNALDWQLIPILTGFNPKNRTLRYLVGNINLHLVVANTSNDR